MERRFFYRLMSGLLAAVMALSLLPCAGPPAKAASAAVTGSITAEVRLDYEQPLSILRQRRLRVEILAESVSLGTVDLTQAGEQKLPGGYAASVTHLYPSGGGSPEEDPRILRLTVDGLAQGAYALRFAGTGYAAYEEKLTLLDHSLKVSLGTGDGTFSLGDFNGDGRVNDRDLALISGALASRDAQDLAAYDLNGDNEINIIDLAWVYRQLDARGSAQVTETTLLVPPVDAGALKSELAGLGVTVISGSLDSLFQAGGDPVTLRENAAGQIVLPITFRQPQELEQVRITSTASAPILSGAAVVEDSQGRTWQYAIDPAVPGGTQLLSAQPGSVITIDLGRRVAVKKITVTVTKTAGGFATVESIEFLKEMTPADPDAAGSPVTGLAAAPGDGKVSLTWNRVPNVAGYLVTWGPVNDPSLTKSLEVDVNRAEITGLENFTAYQFTVAAAQEGWTGKASAPVTATPEPASAPSAPDMVSVSSRENALAVSWKASKGAAWYEVYYTGQPGAATAAYQRFGGRQTGTSAVITGLENGTAYYIYIIAGNDIGQSGPSRISTGTPQAVLYQRPEGIPALGVLDHQDIASIRLAQPGNYSAAEYPGGFDPKNMADGDYRTHWTAGKWWYNEHVLVTFKEPQDLRAVIWVPRLDGTYASNLRAYSVQVWYDGEDLSGPGHLVTPGIDNNGNSDGGDVHTWPAVRGNPAVSKFAVMPFLPQENVIQVSVAAEQRDYLTVSLSELMFVKYDENFRLPEDVEELFADGLRTSLAPGATQARIDQLRARLNSDEKNYYMETAALEDELKLAEELLTGRTGSSVFLNGLESRQSGRDGWGQGGSDLQPLGAAAGANQEITIYASGIPDGESVTVYASQFNAEASAWRASAGTLENGRNVLSIPKIGSQNTPRGGSLYAVYTGEGAENIRLHIRRAVDIPMLDASGWLSMGESERTGAAAAYLAELDRYLETYASAASSAADWHNVTEIATPSVLLSLPAGAVRAGLGSGEREAKLSAAILAWEDIMDVCRTVQGIGGTLEARQNIRCMQMFSGAFMYAAGNHVGIGYGSCAGMVGGRPLSQLAPGASANGLFGWGIAHEIGHNMDKLGRAEITNNIYSLAVQTSDGGRNVLPSRLETGGKYAAIFNKTAQGRPGQSNDVFVQLGMYWQLHLAYDEGREPLDFFSRFFTAWKAGTYFEGASSYDEKVALTAAATAGRDLTEFFTRWGMTLSSAVKDKLASYPKEDRAVWYLNDQSRRDRLDGASGGGSAAVYAAAEKVGDNQFHLTFSAQPAAPEGRIQGYEIRRNGAAIAFVAGNEFTDTIGSGNNLTYQYTVTAYDSLGYAVGSASTQAYKVSYDLLVDPEEYVFSRSGDTVRFDFKRPAAVSGLRLPLAGLDGGSFQVAVTTEDGVTATVRSGDFLHSNQAPENDRFISYFQMAGASANDARIGTYQAESVTITGIPAAVADGGIRLISYAGDDVSFLDGPTVGTMKEDYRYGPGAEDVIKAGTLVVTGTFQGDPVYNTVRIEGEFAPADMAEDGGETAQPVRRYLNGTALLFADEQADGIYTNINNGIFLFIPDVQAERELQENETSCGVGSVLPSRIRAELWRTDEPDSAEGTHRTAQTLWISSPGGSELPQVELKGGN